MQTELQSYYSERVKRPSIQNKIEGHKKGRQKLTILFSEEEKSPRWCLGVVLCFRKANHFVDLFFSLCSGRELTHCTNSKKYLERISVSVLYQP